MWCRIGSKAGQLVFCCRRRACIARARYGVVDRFCRKVPSFHRVRQQQRLGGDVERGVAALRLSSAPEKGAYGPAAPEALRLTWKLRKPRNEGNEKRWGRRERERERQEEP